MSAAADSPTFTPEPVIVPAWLTVDSAAAYIESSPATVYRMVASGQLTAYRPRRGILRLSRDEIDNVMRTAANGRTKRKS